MAEKGLETMGHRLKRFREKANLTQIHLSQLAGVGYSVVRNWEQDMSVPRVDDAFKVAKALGVNLEELLEGTLPKKPRKPRNRTKGE